MGLLLLFQWHLPQKESHAIKSGFHSAGHKYLGHVSVYFFYLEFHVTLNSHNTKPENIGAQWGLVDI